MNRTLHTYLRYIVIVGIYIIPFIPLIVANSLFFPFITGKNFAFRIIVEIICAAWAVLALTDTSYRPRRSWLLYSFAAFVAVIGLADAFGMYPFKSFWSNFERMEGWVTLIHLFAYFIVAATVLAKDKLWDAFFQTSLGVNLVVGAYSLLQIRGLLTINQGGVRVDATFGNATYLAIYSLFHVFIAALYIIKHRNALATFRNWYLALGFNAGFIVFVLPYLKDTAASNASGAMLWVFILWVGVNIVLYLTSWARQERMMYGLSIILSLIALYNTATRGAIIGLIAGVGLSALLIAIFERNRKIIRRTALGVIVVAVIVVVGFVAMKDSAFVRNSPVLSRFASISPTETTTLSRFKLWGMAIEGFKERPILGWGQENFNYVFNTYYNPELYNQEQWFDRTHNVIFDWLIAGGILGLGTYLAFFACLIYCLWKKSVNTLGTTEKSLLTGLLVAYFIHNLFVFDNLTSYLVFMSVAAYIYYKTTALHTRESRITNNQVALPVAVLVLIVALYAVNVRPILANRTLIDALVTRSDATDITSMINSYKGAIAYNTFGNPEIREQLLSRADKLAQTQTAVTGRDEFITLAADEAKKQLELTPCDARYYVFFGTYMSRIGNLPEGIKALTKASELSPKKQSILFALAGTYLNQGDYENAKIALKKAFDAEPNYEAARLGYAATAIYTGDMKLADELLAPLSTSTIAASSDIMNALGETKQYKRLIGYAKYLVDTQPTAQNHLTLAAAYLYSGDKKNAIAELEKAAALEPSFKPQADEYIKQIKEGKL